MQSFTYADSPAGTVLSETDAPSSSQSPAVYTYDPAGRVTSMTPGTGSTLNYGFDASSNLTTLPTGASAATGYDKAGELTSATLSGTTTTYAYDADGQRLTAKQGTATIASGAWNGAGQLTAYSDPAANMSAATYDGNGDRATAATASGTQSFVWDTVTPLPQVLMDSLNAYIYCGGFAPAEQVNLSTGTITFLVTDSLGSVRGTVNSSGTLTGTTNYDAWGNPETTGGLTNMTPYGYAGGYTDPTGLIYLVNRYYDPATGQFVSVDPQLIDTQAAYSYGAGNPVSNTDRTGTHRDASVWCRESWSNCYYWGSVGEVWYVTSRWHKSRPSFDDTPSFPFNAFIDWVNCCTPANVDVVYYRSEIDDSWSRWSYGCCEDAPLDRPWWLQIWHFWDIEWEISEFGWHTWHEAWFQTGGIENFYFRRAPW